MLKLSLICPIKNSFWLAFVLFFKVPKFFEHFYSSFILYHSILLIVILKIIFHASKAMLKILQARLQQYMNWEYPDVQTGFRKGRGTRDQIANIHWIIEKAREFQKNIYFCFIDYAKAFDYVDHNTLWKILKDMAIPDHITCLLRNLYAGQEATVRTQTWNNRLVPNWERVGQGCGQGNSNPLQYSHLENPMDGGAW